MRRAPKKSKEQKKKATTSPRFAPTDEQRYSVELMTGIGIIQDEIAAAIGISPVTLRKYFKSELATGKTRIIAKVADSLIRQALAGNVGAMCFYLKTQAGWRETHKHEHSGQLDVNLDEVRSAIEGKLTRIAGSGQAAGVAGKPH